MRSWRGLQGYLLLGLACCSSAYYLPGTYPQEFSMGQSLQGEALKDAGVGF